MRYLMLVCGNPDKKVDPSEIVPVEPWFEDVNSRGIWIDGDRLRPVSDATTIRDSGRLITDGPFAETTEQIVGFDILECKDLDEAIEVASAHPMARIGAIEVRPFWVE
jgi:hypothetical protein